jgi:hypothetical protein
MLSASPFLAPQTPPSSPEREREGERERECVCEREREREREGGEGGIWRPTRGASLTKLGTRLDADLTESNASLSNIFQLRVQGKIFPVERFRLFAIEGPEETPSGHGGQVPLRDIEARRQRRVQYQALYARKHMGDETYRGSIWRWWGLRAFAGLSSDERARLAQLEACLSLEEIAHFRAGTGSSPPHCPSCPADGRMTYLRQP